MNDKPNKKKKCISCDAEFTPFQTTQRVCGHKCAAIIGKKKVENKINKVHAKEKREFNRNDLSLQKKKAQTAFNAYIRKRDENEPCISCQRHHQGQYHAGHFKTVGARPDLRFNEDNCHKQCAPCNNHLSGNIGEYIVNLINKIGQERLDALILVGESKYTCSDLIAIESKYKDKLKSLNNK